MPWRFPACLFGLVVLLACATCSIGCSSEPAAPRIDAQRGDASPLLFDFTKEAPREEGERVDPATCRHVFVAVGTQPHQTYVNGMLMTRMRYVHRCARCGLTQVETAKGR